MKQDYIAVMDSGLGGLSVLRELRRLLPQERYLYFGDSANAPYGTKTVSEVRRLTLAAAEKLKAQGIKALVVACPDLIVIGMEPALNPAAEHFPKGRVGVMATPLTLREEKFSALLHRFDDTCRIDPIPAPGLVELVEQGKADSPEALDLMFRVLGPYTGKLDALVLGCTHFPFAVNAIRAVLGPEVELLDGGPGTARETKRRLAQAGLLYDGPGELILRNSLPGPEILDLSRKLLG